MNQKDLQLFGEIMAGLAENFGAQLSKVGLRLRMKAMWGYSIEQVEAAAIELLKTKKHSSMPTVAEFIEAIEGSKPRVDDKAVVEANGIISHLNRFGASKYPSLDDPITARLMTTRWPYSQWASQVLESELKWWAKEFAKAYQAEQSVNGTLQLPGNVKGLLVQIGKEVDHKRS